MRSKFSWIFPAFVAGFFATLVFHQGLLALLHALSVSPRGAYSMASTAPLHVPQVISLAFWGGVWGIPIWAIVRRFVGVMRVVLSVVLGAIGPSALALLVIFPMKGLPVDSKLVVGALLLNGAWGLGVWVFMRLQRQG